MGVCNCEGFRHTYGVRGWDPECPSHGKDINKPRVEDELERALLLIESIENTAVCAPIADKQELLENILDQIEEFHKGRKS